MHDPLLTYVVITPARDEAKFIELTMKSMLAQTVHPLKWIIVSDGSTDGTDEIVTQCAANTPWVELIRMPERRERDFAGKVRAFNAGYARMAGLKYDVIVSLDADVSFEADYFSLLLDKLSSDPEIGLVGTPFLEDSGQTYDYRFVSIEHVSGACQVFRRKCFEEIGGYLPVRAGAIDHIAVITARMKGWKTRTFTERACFHHRPMGTAGRSLLRSRFTRGMKDYLIGNHPIWELFRTARQMSTPPLFVGGLALGAGYLWGLIRQAPRPVSRNLIIFHRREQMQRLNRFFVASTVARRPPKQRQPSEPRAELQTNKLPTYALITPARNEAEFVELTLKSMVSQTYRPMKWIIVSDGSTDGTDDIVRKYATENAWIELLRMPERAERHFAGKVHAFNAGYAKVKGLEPDVIGNLDADVSFQPEHFEFLLSRLAEDVSIGVVGAPFREGSRQYNYRFSNIENVWGGCQLFRRECFESIGGYVPVKGGGIDHIAVVSARMMGWKTRTFTEKVCIHHRPMYTAEQGVLKAAFEQGAKDYSLGNHPVWELFRMFYQGSNPPFIISGLLLGAGYLWSMVQRKEVSVSREFLTFTRWEQMRRLNRFFVTATVGTRSPKQPTESRAEMH